MVENTVLLLGCGGPAGYNFVDAVKYGTDEYRFIGVDQNRYMLAAANTDVKERQVVSCDYGMVHPQPDSMVRDVAVSVEYAGRRFVPDVGTVDICQDKDVCNAVLLKHGVSVPEVIDVGDLPEGQTWWLRCTKGAGAKAALPVSNGCQVDGWLNYWWQRGYENFMLSEFLPGREYAYQSVWYEGKLVCGQARERVEYLGGSQSPSGQTSSPSVARTVSREDVYETGVAAVKAVCGVPHGVFGVDMKENVEGVVCVTEINVGRFYTTSNFFAYAGLNMPLIYLDLFFYGEARGPVERLRDDLYWVRGPDRRGLLVDGKKQGW